MIRSRSSSCRSALRFIPVLVLGLAATVSFAPWRLDASAQAPPIILSVVGTNDVHGGIAARNGRGGLALLGGYLANLRAARKHDGGVLLLDGGDMFQGTLESNLLEGAPVVAAYNALGYTAAAIGNHEFDFGPAGPHQFARSDEEDPRGALKARAASARFPFLAANLIDTATGRPVAWPNVRPSTLVEVAGVKVGIVGVITRTALAQTLAANVYGLRVAPVADAILREARALREQGATVVIVTAHAGGRCTAFDVPTDLSSCDPRAEIFEVVRSLPSGLIDAVVGGHTHAGLAHEVAGVPIIESYSTGRSFGRVDLTIDPSTRRVTGFTLFPPRDLCAEVDPGGLTCDPDRPGKNRVPASYEQQPVTPDASVAKLLAPALAAAAAEKARPLGVTLETPVRRGNQSESPLGNLFSDAMRESARGADAAINNTIGGLRTDLPAGPLTFGRLFEVFPFDNRLVRLTLTGRELRQVAVAQLTRSRLPAGISGFRVIARCGAQGLDVALQRLDGSTIGDDERVIVATTDFLATGGDGIFVPVMPRDGFRLPDEAPLVRDEVAKWLTGRGGTIRESDLVDREHPRWSYPGSTPVTCGTR